MENKSLKQIIDNRLEKLKKIRELGIEPYAYDYDSSHHTSEINEKLIDSKVSLSSNDISLFCKNIAISLSDIAPLA